MKIKPLMYCLFIVGCQTNTNILKQPESYTEIVCTTKKNNIGNFNKNITFDKNLNFMQIDGVSIPCTIDKDNTCNSIQKINDKLIFYSINVYTDKLPGIGYLNTAEIKGNMLYDAAYTEMECNRK